MKKIDEVFVFGHSISFVNIKYFDKVKENVQENSPWTVLYYSDEQKGKPKNSLVEIDIDADRIKMIKLTELRIKIGIFTSGGK